MNRYLLLGGTGTLGTALIKRLLLNPSAEITVFSRDELKQSVLKRTFPDVRFMLGDIRNSDALHTVMRSGFDVVFHVAALKQVDTLESNVAECIETNVVATMKVATTAILNCIPYCIFSSTDKAVLPINAYGMAKGLSERYLLSLNESQDVTKFCVYRWGNVIGSRGSAVQYFVEAIKQGKPVAITHKDMTRFWIKIEDAVEFMVDSYLHKNSNDVMLPPKMRAAPVERVVDVIAALMGKPAPEKEYVGIRAGEKIHECIYSSHEMCVRSDNGPQMTDEDLLREFEPVVRKLLDAAT